MSSLLDLMSKDDREKAVNRGKKRLNTTKNTKISPEMYITAEFGYYFGWDAIVAIKRGYIEITDSKGKQIKEPFTLDEVLVLLEAAKKVWYSKLVEQSHGNMVSTSAAYSKDPRTAFTGGIKPFMDRASTD